MKKIVTFLLSIVMLLSLVGCGGSYVATRLVKSQGRNECEAEFGSLKGTLVMDVRVRETISGTISYDAELGEGELSVYYEIDGKKELLFTIKGGQHLDSSGGRVAKGDKVRITIETVGTAKYGEIEIDFD